MKWINEGGIYFPTTGEVTFLDNPGNGVFQVSTPPNPMDKRLGLRRVSDKFEFDFKVYDVGCEEIEERIKKVWNSKQYVESNKNLGVIFNGIKGTGKTVKAKLLCNNLGLPVILVDDDYEGQILPFITNLNFECVIFLDEAEKMFDYNPEILLKLIDGAYNKTRKLYLLTTNKLTLDDNLIDRPGRIRYIQEFGNLSAKAISECIDDNLENHEYKELIISLVDRLEFSTIDILKNIIEEVNILGPKSIDEKVEQLNIPVSSYTYNSIGFEGISTENLNEEIERILKVAEQERDNSDDEKTKKLTPQQFIKEYVKGSDDDWRYGFNYVANKLNDCTWVRELSIKSSSPELKNGLKTNCGTFIEVVKDYPGFFTFLLDGGDKPFLGFLLDRRKPMSLFSVL